MPSFDIVSEVDMHEVTNAVDQANREITTRFDFKGSNASFELKDSVVTLKGSGDFQLKQMRDILRNKIGKRNIDPACLDIATPDIAGSGAKQDITFQQGIDKVMGKKIVKEIKDSKIKVQVAIQEEKVRVTGKKRDDLQQVISLLREKDLGIALQFNNFRD